MRFKILPYKRKYAEKITQLSDQLDRYKKLIEEERKDIDDKYKSYIDNAPNSIMIVDNEGNFIEVNKSTCELTGYKMSELMQKKIFDLIDKEYEKKANTHFKLAKSSGTSSVEIKFVKPDGEKYYAQLEAVKISEERVIGFAFETTKRKITEETLLESNKKFEGIIDRNFDLIYIANNKGYLTYCSTSIVTILRYEPEEVIGKHISNFVSKTDLPRAMANFAKAIMGGRVNVFRMKMKRKDGSYISVEHNYSLIRKNKKIIGLQGIIRDISGETRNERIQSAILKTIEERFQLKNLKELLKVIHNSLNEIIEAKNFYVAIV